MIFKEQIRFKPFLNRLTAFVFLKLLDAGPLVFLIKNSCEGILTKVYVRCRKKGTTVERGELSKTYYDEQ